MTNEEKEELRCAGCGYELEEGAKFCPNCGKPVMEKEIEKNVCKKCGYVFEEKVKFCPECGEKVDEEN